MQLDRTHVVIRVRNLSEIGDLAMVMIRRYPAALLIGFAAGALPWAIANAALLSWIPLQDNGYGLDRRRNDRRISSVLYVDDDAGHLADAHRRCVHHDLLGTSRFRAASNLVECFSGSEATVHEMVLRAWRVTVSRSNDDISWPFVGVLNSVRFADVVVPIFIIIAVALIRAGRPFMPEILLLEQCPLRDSFAQCDHGETPFESRFTHRWAAN